MDLLVQCITHRAADDETLLVADGEDLSTGELARLARAQADGAVVAIVVILANDTGCDLEGAKPAMNGSEGACRWIAARHGEYSAGYRYFRWTKSWKIPLDGF